MKTFSVEIVTPINVIIEENVRYIRCPGLDGSFGVLKNHREGIIALGDYTILPGDRIVVCCLPRSIKRIESLFL